MDQIVIQDLEVSFRVGVSDQERVRPQRLTISVTMETDVSEAAKTDDLTKTIDYYQVSQKLLTYGDGRSWKLIEAIAVEIAEMIVRDFKAVHVNVEVKKFIIPEARWVAVRVRRPQ